MSCRPTQGGTLARWLPPLELDVSACVWGSISGLVSAPVSGTWMVGVIVGLALGFRAEELWRRRLRLPERRALFEFGRKDREPD